MSALFWYNSPMKFRPIKSAISFATVTISYLFSSIPALAQSPKAWTGRCVGTGISADVATIQGLECLFYNLLQAIAALAGIAFFFMFISGGFQYLTSSSDDKKVAAASSTLTMSVVGLIGVIASWFILQIIQSITGVNVTNFFIPN